MRGGDLITLTFRVAAVVNGVIGHCRAERWAVPMQDFRTKSIVGGQDQLEAPQALGVLIALSLRSPISANRGVGDGDGGAPPI